MKAQAICGAICLALAIAATPVTFAVETQGFSISDQEQAVIDATNAEREKAGVPALKSNPILMQAARLHSENMARQKTLAHVLDNKSPEQRVKELGYDYFTTGENVAWNQPDATAVVKSWMNSPHHRDNILNKDFTEIGIGIAENDAGEPYYTQVFGRPKAAGATANAKFTIQNNAQQPVTLKLPNGGAESVLPVGAQGSYSMSGMGKLPDVTVELNGKTQSIPVKDGAQYIVTGDEQTFEVKDASSENGGSAR
jgi:hypothetical protein